MFLACFNYPLQHEAKTKEVETKEPGGAGGMTMLAYSVLLALGLALSSPWWLLRMVTTERYREGLRQRLGAVPKQLGQEIAGRRAAWVHAVSVGEVLAASRLVGELEGALGDEFRVVISTTTRTGQALARERFGAGRVFYMPLDFAFSVRSYLRAIRPAVLVLMESELWPRMLWECRRGGVPVVVANARMSDRSLARAMRLRWIWAPVMRKPALWLAQSEEDARRLAAAGARSETIRVTGNMKYDIRAPRQSEIAAWIRELAKGRSIFVAGSTVEGTPPEEQLVLGAWKTWMKDRANTLLVLAPRHPERFTAVEALLQGVRYLKASEWPRAGTAGAGADEVEAVLLDTIGDLAAVYGVADVAFVGGSMVKRGGHNPLEPAQFGVPVLMGASYENFRDVVRRLQKEDAIGIVRDGDELGQVATSLILDRQRAKAMGERGRKVFEQQQGATDRSVQAIAGWIAEASA